MTFRLADRRIRLLVALFAIAFAVALARSAWLQAVQGPSLEGLASRQQRETVTLQPRRGTILDRQGVPLAIGEQATTVYANPRHVTDPEATAPVVARDLGLDEQTVLEALSDRSRGFVYLARKTDPELASQLELRALPGIGFLDEEKRVYPQRKVGASILGFAGVDNEGLGGLELAYDRLLAGKPGEQTIVHDPQGRVLDVLERRPVKEGRNLTLTIDNRLQAGVERILRQTRAAWGAKAVSAVVLDPRTGGVLAMAGEPGFDANDYGEAYAADPEAVRNRAVMDVYEPGSTFKVVTVAAALEERLVRPSTPFLLPPSIQVADREIHDAEERGTETLTVAQILARSSNVGAVKLALLLGERRLAHWIKRFGFGHLTGIDYPGESPGIVLPQRQWTGSTIGNVPIGHGIAVTPIQMAAVYGAIANGGVWIKPHVVSHVGDERAPRFDRHRIVSRRTARLLTTMMQEVVSEGTGVSAQVPGYTVAGKTGTAAKPDESGGYSDTRYVASFVGFVPARAPRLVILVAVDEPQGQIWGGTVAAPAFRDIAAFALDYLDIRPDAPGAVSRAGG